MFKWKITYFHFSDPDPDPISNVTNLYKLTLRDPSGLLVVEKVESGADSHGGVCDDGFTDPTAAVMCSHFGWTSGRKGPSQLLRNGTEFVATSLRCDATSRECQDRPYPDGTNSSDYMCAPYEQASVYCFNGRFPKPLTLLNFPSWPMSCIA